MVLWSEALGGEAAMLVGNVAAEALESAGNFLTDEDNSDPGKYFGWLALVDADLPHPVWELK